VLFVVFGSFFIGYLSGHENLKFEKRFQPKIVNKELFKPKEVDFSMFWDSWNLIEKQYAGTYDRKKMLYGAISGMVGSLGDPYSMFLNPDDAKKFAQDLEGNFDGIGAELSIKSDQLIIVSPIEDTPAQKAGLKAGDAILKINGEDTSGMLLDVAVSKIRGEKGTKVTLNIFREGWTEAKDFEITRDNIVIKSVKLEWKEGNVAYLRISQFGDDTTSLAQAAADEIISKGAKGVVVDVRDNPGGYLDTSVDIINLFIDKGQVAVMEKTKDSEEKLSTKNDVKIKDIPMVVLINKGSASASEIFAGAIKDYNRGKLIGEKSFGKGSVQTLQEIGNGADLRFTIAEWLTPKGNAINHKGIDPDIEVKITEQDVAAKNDVQLNRAIETVKSL